MEGNTQSEPSRMISKMDSSITTSFGVSVEPSNVSPHVQTSLYICLHTHIYYCLYSALEKEHAVYYFLRLHDLT